MAHILQRDPNAVVVLFPSDHFISPHDRLVEAVADAQDFLTADTDGHIVLLGAEPTTPETDYG